MFFENVFQVVIGCLLLSTFHFMLALLMKKAKHPFLCPKDDQWATYDQALYRKKMVLLFKVGGFLFIIPLISSFFDLYQGNLFFLITMMGIIIMDVIVYYRTVQDIKKKKENEEGQS